MKSAAHTATTLRYMARFQCIGSACEDNCCGTTWRIAVDQPDYVKLERALADSAEDRERFARGCVRTPNRRQPYWSYATLQPTPGGQCVFLTPDRLCGIHATRGAAVLPKVCRTYPRMVLRVGERLELAGTLSCPEVARLCLLADDAVQRETAEPETLRTLLVRQRVPGASRDPWVRQLVPIRAAFLELLSGASYPLASRLYFAVHLARRLDVAHAAEKRRLRTARVLHTIRRCSSAAALAHLDRACRATDASGLLAVVLAQQILIMALRVQVPAAFKALVNAAYGPYLGVEEVSKAGDGAPEYTLRGDELWQAYLVRRARWEGRFPARIAQYFGNYAANYWMRHPYTKSPDLLVHMLQVLVRVAMLRFLLFNHPALQDVGEGQSRGPIDEAVLDQTAVEVFYLFSRAIEHSPPLLRLVRRFLAENDIRGVRHAIELAKF